MFETRKGTAALFRADRRWIAIPSVTPSLTIEVFLKITQESVIPTLPLVVSAFLHHQASFTTLVDEKYIAISRIFNEYAWGLESSVSDLINILKETQFSIYDERSSLINCSGIISSDVSTSWSFFSNICSEFFFFPNFQESFLLLLLIYFSGEIPEKNIYSVLLRCNPLIVSNINAFMQSSLLFILKSLISRLNSFIISFAGLASCKMKTASLVAKSLLFSNLVSSIISLESLSNLVLFASRSQFLNLLWHKSLILETLIKIGVPYSLIGTILVELGSSFEFRRLSEFTTEILTLLTSSIPLPEPKIPCGKTFFTNLGRIYAYSITDLTRV